MYINLVYTCGTSTNLVFNAKLTRIADTAANCQCFGNFLCQDFTIKATCPGSCAAGPSPDQPTVRRADESLGYTDYNMLTRVNATSLTVSQLQRAMYLQTIQITGRAVQNNNANNLHIELELDKTAAGANKLIPISAVATVTRGGSVLSTTNFIASNFVTTASTLTKTNMDLDLTSCFSGVILANDEIVVVAKYKVATNDLVPTPTLPSGIVWRYYNLNGGGTKDFCYDWVPQLYLLGTYVTHDNFYYYGFSAGCNTSTPQILERNCYSGGTQLFPNEYIPGRNFMKFTLTIPTGFEFDHLTLGNGGRGYGIPTITLTPSSQTATTVTFDNDGSWVPTPVTPEIYYAEVWVVPYFRPTCGVVNPVIIPNSGEYIKVKSNNFYYSNLVPLGTIPTDNSLQTDYTYYHGPSVAFPTSSQVSIALTNQSGTIQALQPTESLIVRISNASANAAPYNWIAIPNVIGLTITEVRNIATNTIVSGISYAGGIIYNLSTTGLTPGNSSDYKISFTYSNCGTNSFSVLGGWNCNSYPTSPDNYTCGINSVLLTYTTISSEIQVAEIIQPITTAMCASQNHLFEISNSQASNVKNSTFTLTMPVGYLPVGASFQVQYPRNSGTWQTVTPTIVGNVYTFNLTSHTSYPSQGIPGTIYSTTADDRFMRVKFQTNTDCDFVPGGKFQYSVAAKGPCGALANGSNINTYSN
jgi:hypothetical protein